MGDDDDLSSFTDTQHAATSSLAQIAIQSELASLVSDSFIPYEEKTATITLTTARLYSLASDFQTFQELFLEKVDASGDAVGTRILKYAGGEDQLRKDYNKYREDTGTPIHFYPTGGTSKQIGLQPVPDSASVGDVYRYYYEADVNVSVATDTIPFHTTTEAQVFVRMCSRHFKYLRSTRQVREQLFPHGVDGDPEIASARATLMRLVNPLPPRRHYARRYGKL